MPLTLTERQIMDKLHLPDYYPLIGKLREALKDAGIVNKDFDDIEPSLPQGEWREGAFICSELNHEKLQQICKIKNALEKAEEEREMREEGGGKRERKGAIVKNIAAFTGKACGGRKRKTRKSKKRSRKTRRR